MIVSECCYKYRVKRKQAAVRKMKIESLYVESVCFLIHRKQKTKTEPEASLAFQFRDTCLHIRYFRSVESEWICHV